MCSPEYQPQLWTEWRERINNWAGGIDTYQVIYDEVRTNSHTLAENVEPRRWWKA
jgi:TRAP-type transport system periplasmic protein